MGIWGRGSRRFPGRVGLERGTEWEQQREGGAAEGKQSQAPCQARAFGLFQGAIGRCSQKPPGLSQGKQLR